MAKKVTKNVAQSPDLKAAQDAAGKELVTTEEVEAMLEEIAAKRDLDQQVKEAKAALKASRGRTIDLARAREIAEERAATTVESPVY